MGDKASPFDDSIRKDATYYRCHAHRPPNKFESIGDANGWTKLMNKIREGRYQRKNIIISE